MPQVVILTLRDPPSTAAAAGMPARAARGAGTGAGARLRRRAAGRRGDGRPGHGRQRRRDRRGGEVGRGRGGAPGRGGGDRCRGTGGGTADGAPPSPPPSKRPADLPPNRTVFDLPPLSVLPLAPAVPALVSALDLPATRPTWPRPLWPAAERRLGSAPQRRRLGDAARVPAWWGRPGQAAPFRARIEVDDTVLTDGDETVLACAVRNAGPSDVDGLPLVWTHARTTDWSRSRSPFRSLRRRLIRQADVRVEVRRARGRAMSVTPREAISDPLTTGGRTLTRKRSWWTEPGRLGHVRDVTRRLLRRAGLCEAWGHQGRRCIHEYGRQRITRRWVVGRFSPHSPWSQPPIHRPAPRPDPECPRSTPRAGHRPLLHLDPSHTVHMSHTAVRDAAATADRFRRTPSTCTKRRPGPPVPGSWRWACTTRCRPPTSSPPGAPSGRGNGWPPPAYARGPPGDVRAGPLAPQPARAGGPGEPLRGTACVRRTAPDHRGQPQGWGRQDGGHPHARARLRPDPGRVRPRLGQQRDPGHPGHAGAAGRTRPYRAGSAPRPRPVRRTAAAGSASSPRTCGPRRRRLSTCSPRTRRPRPARC